MAQWNHQQAFTVGYDAALRGDKYLPIGEPGTIWHGAYVDGYERGLQENKNKTLKIR